MSLSDTKKKQKYLTCNCIIYSSVIVTQNIYKMNHGQHGQWCMAKPLSLGLFWGLGEIALRPHNKPIIAYMNWLLPELKPMEKRQFSIQQLNLLNAWGCGKFVL